jgi:hypothetical protein
MIESHAGIAHKGISPPTTGNPPRRAASRGQVRGPMSDPIEDALSGESARPTSDQPAATYVPRYRAPRALSRAEPGKKQGNVADATALSKKSTTEIASRREGAPPARPYLAGGPHAAAIARSGYHRRQRRRSPHMFESIVSKIANTVRNVVRAIGAATREAPWLAPVAIVALFLLV